MKCAICKGEGLKEGRTTVTLTRGKTTIVIRDTPAEICPDCGEYYLSETVTREVLARAEEAAARNTEVEILSYAA